MSPRHAQTASHSFILSQIEDVVRELRVKDTPEIPVRERVQLLILLRRLVNDYGASLIPNAASGLERLIAYLQAHVGEIIDSEELSAISGIQDAPRRLREMRKRGYRIVSGVSEGYEHLNLDQYILLVPAPDID